MSEHVKMSEQDRDNSSRNLSEDMAELRLDVDAMKKDVSEVKNAVVGNSSYRQLGVMERLEKLELWQTQMMFKVAFLSGMVACAVGLGWKVIEKFIQ